MPEVSATINIPDEDLARLLPAPAVDAHLLTEVRDLLRESMRLQGQPTKLCVSMREAAEMLDLSERTLGELDVPYVKIGSRRVYRVAALEQWLIEHEKQPEALAH
jgi:hypothetical protein